MRRKVNTHAKPLASATAKLSIDSLSSIMVEKFYSNREYYEMMETWHQKNGGLGIEPKTKEIIDNVINGLGKGKTVLEMGCGEGSITLWFANRFKENKFRGVDISPIGIELAKNKAGNAANVEFDIDDIVHSQLKDSSCSFVILQSVIEHVIDYEKVLGEAYRILEQGGHILIRVGNGGRKRHGVIGLTRDAIDYLLGWNIVGKCHPTFEIKGTEPSERDKAHMHEFDLFKIPSDVLVKSLRKTGFVINYFSTCRELYLLGAKNPVKRALLRAYIGLNVFPLNHLGGVVTVLAQKPMK